MADATDNKDEDMTPEERMAWLQERVRVCQLFALATRDSSQAQKIVNNQDHCCLQR
jgi:hypothetical protein